MNDIGLFVFRVSLSLFMFFGHGLGKLTRLFSGDEIKFFSFLGLGPVVSLTLAGFAEGIAALLVALGLFTRLSSFSLFVTMAIAAFIAHGDDPFSRQEKALMYMVSYFLIMLTGPGKYSIQNLFKEKFNRSNKYLRYILG